MPSETSFSTSERSLLKELPFKVILAAVAADVKGPVGAAGKEMVIGARSLVSSATAQYAENSLIMGILAEVAEDPASESEIALDDDQARQSVIVEALAYCQNASVLLTGHPNDVEVAQYRQWVYEAAAAVTEATKSGGILGFGAVTVSDKEEAFLIQLRLALGIGDEATPATEE